MALQFPCLVMALAVVGCATYRYEPAKLYRVPYMSDLIKADGNLDEECYRKHAPLTSFVVAADPTRKPPPTKAWLFWNEHSLVCAFECVDSTPAWAVPAADERNVDGQDRAEFFLWTGDSKGPYFCIEAAPGGAIHDYQARFYRKFDDGWFPAAAGSPAGGWAHKAVLTPGGYTVEMIIPKSAIEAMGLKLGPGARFKIGLFRADYDKFNGRPTWITWVDHGREPDFHTADSFGTALLMAPSATR